MLSNLLDFAKHIGRKVFDTDAEAADEILKHIQSNNPGVDTLRVAFDDGVVTLTGRAADQAAKEKVVLMAGNVKGVERVVADGISVIPSVTEEQRAAIGLPERPAAAAAPADTAPTGSEATRFYIIQKGDTLYGIAKQFYGNGMKYPQLFDANREVIEDPDKIYPGQKIRVPELG
ncbi:MAG: peptidoglycan-binding protein LysM [Pseudomonadales bacterium]